MYTKDCEIQFNNLIATKKDIIIMGIESSCDETSVAIVKNGRELLSNIISSQIEIHKRFGGVVPEVASRNHILAIDNIIDEALQKSNLTFDDIDAIAVTYGAGLVGSLMVGVNYAKALAYALNIPLIKVNHIKGHITANYLNTQINPPYISLIVSGGHTALIEVNSFNDSKLIGTTLDDAVGECFDKVAKVLGLEYPGGVVIDKKAQLGAKNITFIKHKMMANTFDFSFSGLKTAVINYVHNAKSRNETLDINDICTSFEVEAIEPIVEKTMMACKQFNKSVLLVGGGVSANSYLRKRLEEECMRNNINVLFPKMELCGDNAGMIASEGYFELINGKGLADLTLTATPNIPLE